MALTLMEAAKVAINEGKTIRAGVIEMFARASALLAAIPFKDIQGNAYQYNRESNLSGVAFRNVNGTYPESTGVVNQLVEALRICGGDLDVDTFIVKTQGQVARAVQEQMKVKALAAEMTRVIIKGDSTSTPAEIDGLQNRIVGGQLIENSGVNGGGALSLIMLDELLDTVPEEAGRGRVLVMNKALRRRLTVAARTAGVGGNIDYALDDFGRQVTRYNGVPIVNTYPDNGGTDPLAFDEVGSGGATATATSIYCLALGDGLVTGIQSGGMDVRDLGELDTAPKFRTRVEWFAGMAIEHGRAAARLRGISNVAAVA
ncbi:major capsid protein [Gemmatimonas sp.]|uniref:major capsid protein n=1 Tax=Gemmatimonas sp. TaxID=1962908 RepID=UPI00356850BE